MNHRLRNLLFLLFCLLTTGINAEEVVFVFKDLNIGNGQDAPTLSIGDVTLTFDKSEGTNPPRFYDSDLSLRLYKGNKMTISSTSDNKPLKKVVMTFVSQKYAPQSGVNYGVNLNTSGNKSTWEGSLQLFTITNVGSEQLRLTEMTVTVGEDQIVPEVTSLTDLKALESGTLAWLSLGRDNPGYIEYAYDANATEAYVRDDATAVRFYDFLPDDPGWHTHTGGALIGRVLGKYEVNKGMPEFTHVDTSIADSILCLDYYHEPSVRSFNQISDLTGSTYRADLVEVTYAGITYESGQYFLTRGDEQLSISNRFNEIDIPADTKYKSYNITGILGTTSDGSSSQLYCTDIREVVPDLALNEALSNNASLIGVFNGRNVNVTLTRKMTTGTWNTLCLPFDVAEFSDIVASSRLAALSSFNAATNTLEFTSVSSLEAGVPYLVFPEEDVESITIQGTIIDSELKPVSQSTWEFVGIYDPTTLYAGDTSVLFLGEGNTLYYPNVTNDLKAFRAYFRTTGQSSANICVDGISTGITTATLDGNEGDGRIYNVSGQFMGDQTRNLPKGVYLRNGNKIIVK